MAKYVFRNGRFTDPRTGEAMPVPDRDGLCTPQVIADIEPYLSPVDGKYVSGRAAKRDDLARTGCVDTNDITRDKKLMPKGKFKNERFAKKWNLPLADEARK